jgi:GR25 family glycosyltransferase involved in LPS biosynthesis
MYSIKNDYIKWSEPNWSTTGYYINRKGMKKILDRFYKNGTIDISMKLRNYVADCCILYENMITYNYTKPTIYANDFRSDINPNPDSDYEVIVTNYINDYFNLDDTSRFYYN